MILRIILIILCYGIIGGLLATENITPTTWKYWVIICCVAGVQLTEIFLGG